MEALTKSILYDLRLYLSTMHYKRFTTWDSFVDHSSTKHKKVISPNLAKVIWNALILPTLISGKTYSKCRFTGSLSIVFSPVGQSLSLRFKVSLFGLSNSNGDPWCTETTRDTDIPDEGQIFSKFKLSYRSCISWKVPPPFKNNLYVCHVKHFAKWTQLRLNRKLLRSSLL